MNPLVSHLNEPMSLREQCQSSLRSAKYLAQVRFPVPRLSETANACRYPDVPPVMPDEEELQNLYKRFGHAFATDSWHDVAWQDWRRAPWVLWYGKKIHMPAIQRGFLPRLLEQLSGDEAAVKRLIYIYLRDFSEHKPNVAQVAEFLRQHVEKALPSSLLYRWKISQQRYQLFSLQDIAGKLAQTCLLKEALEVLDDAGLRGELRNAGFAQSAYLEALKMLDKGLHRQPLEVIPLLPNFFRWSLDGEQLRYPACRRELLHTLLLPWLQSAPPPALREALQIFLVQRIGHPGQVEAPWQDVRTPALRILHYWLSDSLLEAFFQLTEQQQPSSNWRIRQEFWAHYQKRGLFDAAWLVCGETAAQTLATRQDIQGAYAVQSHIEGNAQEVVLLVRLQNVLIADWIEAGYTYVWQSKNPYIPEPYKPFYEVSGLSLHAEKIPHNDHWRQALGQIIRQYAQLPVLLK